MEALISEVQQRNILWNKKNPHRNKFTIEREWEYVAYTTGLSKDDAKKKWRNLRDQFLKEIKRIPQAKTANADEIDANYNGKWQHFSSLLFLLESVVPRATEAKIHMPFERLQSPTIGFESEDDVQEPLDEKPDISEIQLTTIEEPLAWDNQGTTETKFPSVEPTFRLQRKRSCTEDATYNSEQKRLSMKSKKMAMLQMQEDENFLFLRSLLPYMQRLEPMQQLRVRTKFQEVLMQEMQQGQRQNFCSVAASSAHSNSSDML